MSLVIYKKNIKYLFKKSVGAGRCQICPPGLWLCPPTPVPWIICHLGNGEFPHGRSLPSATIPAPEPGSCSCQPESMVGNATSETFHALGKMLWGLGKVQTSVVLGGVCIFSW